MKTLKYRCGRLFRAQLDEIETSFLSTGNSIFLFRVFLCQWKLLLKLGGSQFLKKKYIPAREHQFFRYFQRFQDFIKWRYLFRIVETHFSSNPSFSQGKGIFCLVEKVLEIRSVIRAIFVVVGIIIGIRGKKVFKKRVLSHQWTTDFLATRNNFLLHFSETPASDSFFCLVF